MRHERSAISRRRFLVGLPIAAASPAGFWRGGGRAAAFATQQQPAPGN